MIHITREELEKRKAAYPEGTIIELVKMDDEQAPPKGTRGTVAGVDDTGSLLVRWETGSSLNVLYKEDEVRYFPYDAYKGTTKDDTLKRAIEAEEDETISLMDTIREEMETDCDASGRKLLSTYLNANEFERSVMDTVLVELCGWTMETIMKKAFGEYPEA